MYHKGDRVSTPYGLGTIVFARMKPPSYSEAAAYSVFLDSKKNDLFYNGTTVKAEDVKDAT